MKLNISQFLQNMPGGRSEQLPQVFIFWGSCQPVFFRKVAELLASTLGCDVAQNLAADQSVPSHQSNFLTQAGKRLFQVWVNSADGRLPETIFEPTESNNSQHYLCFVEELPDKSLWEKSSIEVAVIEVPSVLRSNEMGPMCRAVGISVQDSKRLLAAFRGVSEVSPDVFCMAVEMLTVEAETACEEYILREVQEPVKLLYPLVGELLSKNRREFYRRWTKVSSMYPPQFWISFLSNQLISAMAYLAERPSLIACPSDVRNYKLPIKFLRGSWRLHSIENLGAAHQLLFDLDFAIKNGAGTVPIELVFEKIMQNGSV